MRRRSEECGAGSAWQGRLRDDDRQTVGIADITGGHAFRASTLDALDEAYATLQQHIGYEILHSDASAGWIRLGAGVLAAALLAGILLNRRLPGWMAAQTMSRDFAAPGVSAAARPTDGT